MASFLESIDQSGDIRTIADDAGALDLDGTRRQLFKRAGVAGGAAVGASAAFGLLSPLEAFASTAGATGQYSTSRKSAKNDLKIGNYALTLEFLEAAFYKQARDGGKLTDADIALFVKTVAAHEASHVKILKAVLGNKAVSSPTVDFSSVLTDQTTILKTAAALEPVGTAAYAGAGPHIKSLPILKAALSIHSVEANHAAWAAALVNYKGVDPTALPAPHAFNPSYGYKKTLKIVSSLKVVTGNLHP